MLEVCVKIISLEPVSGDIEAGGTIVKPPNNLELETAFEAVYGQSIYDSSQ